MLRNCMIVKVEMLCIIQKTWVSLSTDSKAQRNEHTKKTRCQITGVEISVQHIHIMTHCGLDFFFAFTGSSGYRFRICRTRSSKTLETCQFFLADVSKNGRFHRWDRLEIVLSWTSRSLTRSDLVPTTTIGTDCMSK